MRIAFVLALVLQASACKSQGQGQAADTMTKLPGSAGMNPEDNSKAHSSPLTNSPSAQPPKPLVTDGGARD